MTWGLSAARGVGIVAALTVGAGSWLAADEWRQAQREVVDFIGSSLMDRTRPGLDAVLRREADPDRARLRAARAFVAQQLDNRWLDAIPPEEREEALRESVHALAQVGVISRSVLRQRPASWEAWLLLGAARYLELVRAGPGAAVAAFDEWERPLLRARATAPARSETALYLAVAYVREWTRMDPDQRERAVPVLREAFENAATFSILYGNWNRVEHDPSVRAAALPDLPHVWSTLASDYVAAGDWRRAATARNRWRASSVSQRRVGFERARARVGGGDMRRGWDDYRNLVGHLEVGAENFDLLEEILSTAPPVALESAEASLRRWLDWILDLCFLGRCPLSDENLERLAKAAMPLEPSMAALAALAYGDLAGGERVEREAEETWAYAWGRYQILRTEALLDRGETDEASGSLLRTHPDWQTMEAYWRARLRLAEATADMDERDLALGGLQAVCRSRWRPASWIEDRSEMRLFLCLSAPSETLRLSGLVEGDRGALLDVVWDDEVLGSFGSTGADEVVEVPVAATAGSYRLMLRQVAGGALTAPSVELSAELGAEGGAGVAADEAGTH